jgi:TolB-like protein/DNA-binding winged helix-turn-helix (wHTH) protein/Tfp pilus assembly protein PilF
MESFEERIGLFDGFALDLARGCLTHSGQAVHLRPLTYEVLKYLVENRGHLISKDKLIDEVWHGRAVTDGSLGKCIEEVREALGPESRQYIRNVRGRGYIFDTGTAAGEPHLLQAEQLDVISVRVTEQSEESPEIAGSPDRGVQLNRDSFDLSPFTRDLNINARLERSALTAPPSARSSQKTILYLAAGLVLLAVAVFAYLRYSNGRIRPIDSIAVLPFVNATGDDSREYLSDGVSDSVINSLSRLPRLRVMSRNSVYGYKGRNVDVRAAGAELGVQAILLGRVEQHGDELSIKVELINAADNTQIWGEQYNQKFTNVVTLQQEIARDVSHNLQARLTPADEQLVDKHYTRNADAYESYLKGRYYTLRFTLPEIRKGISFYQQAIAADPAYALAYAGIAEAYRSLAIAGWGVPSREAYPQAKAAATRALEIDPNLPEAHIALGWIAFSYHWDWQAAEREFKRAIELSPNNADAHRGYAHLFSILGRGDEAIAEGKRARELDPLSLITNALEGQFLFYAGHLDEARARFQKTLEIDPGFWIARNGLARVDISEGRFEDANRELRKAITAAKNSTEPVTQLGYSLARSGKQSEARETLAMLWLRATQTYVPAYSFAMIHNGLGEKEEALKYLEQSLAEREVQITFVKIDKRWDGLRSDPRFQNLVQRIGFPS